MSVQSGDEAPDFELPDQDGEPVKLSDLRGSPVVLLYGKTYWGAQRATFVIDAEGRVADVIPKVSPKTHDEPVLQILGSM